MKKTYIQPSTLLTRVAVQQMICTSTPEAALDPTQNVDASSIESRRTSVSVWGEDEEEY